MAKVIHLHQHQKNDALEIAVKIDPDFGAHSLEAQLRTLEMIKKVIDSFGYFIAPGIKDLGLTDEQIRIINERFARAYFEQLQGVGWLLCEFITMKIKEINNSAKGGA